MTELSVTHAALFILWTVAAWLAGYLIATMRCVKHLRDANDINEKLLKELERLSRQEDQEDQEDPADWWKA